MVRDISGGQEEEDRALVSDFAKWSGRNHLPLNMFKTRKMVIDFRRKRTASIWGCTQTANWAGGPTLGLCTRRGR